MQVFARPRFVAEPALRLLAQLPESCPGAARAVLLLSEIG